MLAVGEDQVIKKCDQIRSYQEDNTNLGQMVSIDGFIFYIIDMQETST